MNDPSEILLVERLAPSQQRQAQGPWADLALHTLGWKAFQDLCAQVCEEILKRPVEIYREAQDGGQDAVFLSRRLKSKPSGEPATIQCKFTSKPNRRLRPSDLRPEEAHVVALKTEGHAETYALMTNMSVDAPVAVAIKGRLRELGVLHPHVFGREFLTQVIRASARLRALVPRVYGLGDLSLILDERRAEQTKALLGHMLPTLKVYVPTNPHLRAVRALAEHGIVLLLGDPATGKSTIAAILATTAAEDGGHPCYKSDGPDGLLESWNPNEPSGFYWIDHAFGPNQPREDYIDRWIAIMPKIQAAVADGNRFVLTSRRHIYEAAKPKLGSRNHPLFRDRRAIVDVGELTNQERRQILYNHIKAGTQSSIWKSRVKPQLDSLADEPLFLPEIARRLSDPAYTKHISTANDTLLKFIREPKEHLLQTIRELSKLHRAALTLVFLHRGQMPIGAAAPEMQQLVLKHFAVDAESLGQAILHLRDSFLVQTNITTTPIWTFKHPTIADAIGAILGETEGMGELYLRGTKSEAILTEAVCVGAAQIPDAVVIPEALNELLVERLAELPDEQWVNRLLFAFLDERASDRAFEMFVTRHPTILSRIAIRSWRLRYDPKLLVHARAHALRLLPADLRAQSEEELAQELLYNADASFLDDDTILALIRPTNLLHLAARIRDELLGQIPSMAAAIEEDADLEQDAADNFDDLRSSLRALRGLFRSDKTAEHLLGDADASIDSAIASIEDKKKKKEKDKDDDDNDWNWENYAPGQSLTVPTVPPLPARKAPRSIFSDVDQ
jgi:hypothetical protein